jgi:hypothetical protein
MDEKCDVQECFHVFMRISQQSRGGDICLPTSLHGGIWHACFLALSMCVHAGIFWSKLTHAWQNIRGGQAEEDCTLGRARGAEDL